MSLPLHSQHQRDFANNRFVYPVLSRRSNGLSVGVNLNPDKVCNFDCIYCQVDRRDESETRFVGQQRLLEELESMLQLCASGAIYQTPKFQATPPGLRRLNDIAFSGDGEPTTYRNFDELMESCAAVKRRLGLSDVRMVLITNASMLHREHVRRGLEVLDANQGQVWAKLDAGSESYYQLVERTKIPFSQILSNLTEAARRRPLVIQSLFMNIHGVGPDDAEIDAYCGRLTEVLAAGGSLELVQVYTIARRPPESYVAPLDDREVDAIAEAVRERTGLPAIAYYGSSAYENSQ